MKSAYELAMERLEKESPTTALTEEQKEQLADIDRVYDAKIAEREVFLKESIKKAKDATERKKLEQQLVAERNNINDERESKKNKVRG
ncbi:hypothetical protein [Cerasicoccus fimbriatus]|uniref:hypothetical protein n=1 Tax=Cerasicoccus fimbriatus TaxID=3014554 RepID=UPI0022B35C4E|nr:hypothetical protein [Cerasicoccus sp. TK19100]